MAFILSMPSAKIISLGVFLGPSFFYGLAAFCIYSIKQIPDLFVLAFGFFLSPVYLILLFEEKLGGRKLAKIINEKEVSILPELLFVVSFFTLLLYFLDILFAGGCDSLSFRVVRSCACIVGACLICFIALLLAR
jgi:hypothetical protein